MIKALFSWRKWAERETRKAIFHAVTSGKELWRGTITQAWLFIPREHDEKRACSRFMTKQPCPSDQGNSALGIYRMKRPAESFHWAHVKRHFMVIAKQDDEKMKKERRKFDARTEPNKIHYVSKGKTHKSFLFYEDRNSESERAPAHMTERVERKLCHLKSENFSLFRVANWRFISRWTRRYLFPFVHPWKCFSYVARHLISLPTGGSGKGC